jgi:hypothetical protein
MIGNDIPGLRVIEDFHAGCLVDEDRLVTIKTALQRIEDDYHSYSVGAKQLYDGVDNKSIIASVLNSL